MRFSIKVAIFVALICHSLCGGGLYGQSKTEAGTSLRDLVEKVSPSVVTIEVPGVGLGSGFLVDDQGTIVTNFHVVTGGKEAKVTFGDGAEAKVLGFVAVSIGRDLAALRADIPRGRRPHIRVSEDEPRPGDSVIALGAPKALRGSVTDGIVSAIRKGSDVRDVLKATTGEDIYTERLAYDLDVTWIQTSAPISGGNSGGPLVNRKGEVIGVLTWHRPDGQNLNFAAAGSHVRDLLKAASVTPKPLTELPQPSVRRRLPTLADGPKTLEFWNKRREILGESSRLIPSVNFKSPNLKGLNRKLNQIHSVFLDNGTAIRELSIVGVDEELVQLAFDSADVDSRLILAMLQFTAAETVQQLQEKETQLKDMVARFDENHRRFDELRIALSKRYNLEFPTSVAIKPDPKPADKPPTNPAAASSYLKQAKSLLDANKRDAARERLKKIVDQYPDTEEAKEAAALLEKRGK